MTAPPSRPSEPPEEAAERALEALQTVSNIVDSGMDSHQVLVDVLAALERPLGAARGAISLVTEQGPSVVAEIGGGAGEQKRSRELAGHFRFVSVPVAGKAGIIGSLAVELPPKGPLGVRAVERLLAVVASMVTSHLQACLAEQEPSDGADVPDQLVGNSRAMARIRQAILEVASRDTAVLVCGEPGTGKGLVAAAIHRASQRSEGPLLRLDCTALNESSLRRERFADLGRSLGAAFGATLLLDEVGGVSPAAQLGLLEFLRERELDQGHASATRSGDIRIIATTARDLEMAVRQGKFRRDLYCRISVLVIFVPPLRDHLEDVAPLAEFFLRRHGARLGKPVPVLGAATLDALLAHPWPDNVRELENSIAWALATGNDPLIHLRRLTPFARSFPDRRAGPNETGAK
jgi:DNA-binding NtrC family response regulator